MLDTTDKPMTVRQAAAFCSQLRADGRPVTQDTIYRWIRRGIRGVRLETLCVGQLLIRPSALERFFRDSAGGKPAVQIRQQKAEHKRAEERMRKRGFGRRV